MFSVPDFMLTKWFVVMSVPLAVVVVYGVEHVITTLRARR